MSKKTSNIITISRIYETEGLELNNINEIQYDIAGKIFEDKELKTLKKTISLNYRTKNGILTKDANNSIVTQETEIKQELLETENRKRSSKSDPKLLQTGLILLTNRSDFWGPAFSYPHTFVINRNVFRGEKLKSKNHIKDIQRIISIESFEGKDGKSNDQGLSKLKVLNIIDLYPTTSRFNKDLNKIEIQVKRNIFYLYSNSKYSGIFLPSKYIFADDPIVNRFEIRYNEVLEYFNEESQKYELIEKERKNIYEFDEILIENDENQEKYFNFPIEDLDYASLFISEYYMRNLESPSYRGKDVLNYLKINFDNVKNVFKNAFFIGEFPIIAPRDQKQPDYLISSGQLDNAKIQNIWQFIESTKKQTTNVPIKTTTSQKINQSINQKEKEVIQSDSESNSDFMDEISFESDNE